MKRCLTIKHIVLTGAAAVGLGWGCTRPGAPDFPDHQPRLVLHSFTAVGDTFKVTLDQSIGFEEPTPEEPRYVRNATVVLYEEGVPRDTLAYDPQEEKYVSDAVTAVAGKTYKIVAQATPFDPAEATTAAPAAVAVGAVTRAPSNRTLYGGGSLEDVSFTLTDPADNNYYIASLQSMGGFFCVYTSDAAFEKYAEGLVPLDQNDCIYNNELLFNDRPFNGTARALTISTHPSYLEDQIDANGHTVRPLLHIYHVTEAFYRYIKAGLGTNLSIDAPSLFEPVRVQGNVKGGYGMFTVFARTTNTVP